MTDKLVYTLNETAEMLALSVSSVLRLIKAGDLRTIHLNEKSVRITATELERFIAACEAR